MASVQLANSSAPNDADVELARQASEHLANFGRSRKNGNAISLRVVGDRGNEHALSIPASAFQLFFEILDEMGKGNAVALLPMQAELSTQQAADLLKVSRPFLVSQMDGGAIPFRKVGAHRRVLVADLLEYRRRMHAGRLKALEELAAQAQELNMGY